MISCSERQQRMISRSSGTITVERLRSRIGSIRIAVGIPTLVSPSSKLNRSIIAILSPLSSLSFSVEGLNPNDALHVRGSSFPGTTRNNRQVYRK